MWIDNILHNYNQFKLSVEFGCLGVQHNEAMLQAI